MKKLYGVGDNILFSEFAFENKSGGIGMSNWEYDEKFPIVGSGIITKAWFDYECGWRFHCEPTSKSLIEYIKRNSHRMIVFVSEFDIIS